MIHQRYNHVLVLPKGKKKDPDSIVSISEGVCWQVQRTCYLPMLVFALWSDPWGSQEVMVELCKGVRVCGSKVLLQRKMHFLGSSPSQPPWTFPGFSTPLQWGAVTGGGAVRWLNDPEVALCNAWGSVALINTSCSDARGQNDNRTIALVICREVGNRKVFSLTGLMLVEYSWGTYR